MRYAFEPHPGSIFPGGFFCPKSSLRSLGILLTGVLWLLKIGFTFKTVQYRIFENFVTHLALPGAFGHAPTPQKTILYVFSGGSSSRGKKMPKLPKPIFDFKISVFFSRVFGTFSTWFFQLSPPQLGFQGVFGQICKFQSIFRNPAKNLYFWF